MEITSLKQQLPRGWQKKLAARTGFHPGTVEAHINGRAKKINTKIIEAAVELALEYQSTEQKLVKKLKKLIPQSSHSAAA